MITTAPEAASIPYKAEASGPLRIVIFSISSGLISAPLLVKSTPRLFKAVPLFNDEANTPVEVVALLIGKPSTTNKGWLLPLNELIPLITIDVEAPGSPEVELISTPGTLPASALIKFSRCVCATVSPLTSVTA